MAWFGESLSSLTGHLQNLTKEVLSEASDEAKGAPGDLKATKEKLEELEGICAAQDLEISALKKQNAELRRRLELAGCLEDAGQAVVPAAATTWLSVEQRCDAAYTAGAQARGGAGRGHTRALSDATAVAAKHQERLEKELKERIQVIEHLQMQLQKVEQERHELSQTSSTLEQQVQHLSKQVIAQEESIKEKRSSALQIDDKLVHENNELRTLLNEANKRTRDLEEELLNMHNQCLDNVIDSQVSTSELRLDVEQTRKRIANEAGVQRAEKLRAHQDMVNRMIQMGEKTRECEDNVKRLQGEDKKLAADMASKIQKLGDQEQQELIQGTLKALELENQVLNMRNAQLERESLKDMEMKIEEGGKSLPDGIYLKVRSNEATRSEDDMDNLSYHSELSEVTLLSQRFENQITQLQNQVETYKKEVKLYEKVKDDLSREKSDILQQVQLLEDKLQEQQISNAALLKKTSIHNKLQDQDHYETLVSSEKVRDLEQEIEKSRESMKFLHEEKQCLGQELEAMARVVQDLEAKVASGEEERRELVTSMEELDQQHQDAIDKLLGLRNSELAENEQLKFEIQELKIAIKEQPESYESSVQTDSSHSAHSTQTDCIHRYDQKNQTSFVHHDKATLTDKSEKKINQISEFSKYDIELSEKIKKLINFDIPNDLNNATPRTLHLVQEIVKIVNDCKWKKDTLERKVAELIRENKEDKSTITILEAECSNLKENVDRLAEQLVGVAKSGADTLPTILENSEEMEALEQKTAMLEEEIAVLRETRVNLEEDAARMREERDDLREKIRNLEAQQRNQENLQTELQRFVADATTSVEKSKTAVDAAEKSKMSAENEVRSLTLELEVQVQNYEKQLVDAKETANNLDVKNRELLQDVVKKEAELNQCHKNISELESERNSLIIQLQQNSQEIEKVETVAEEKLALQCLVSDLQVQLHNADELKERFTKVSEDLKETLKAKGDMENQLDLTAKHLHDAQLIIKHQNDIETEMKKWQNTASREELKVKEALVSLFRLEEENKILKDKLLNEESFVKNFALKNQQHEMEMEELRDRLERELKNRSHQELINASVEELQSEVNDLKNIRNNLEKSLSETILEIEKLKKEKHEEVQHVKLLLLQKEETEAVFQRDISAISTEAQTLSNHLESLNNEYSEKVSGLEEENGRLSTKIKTLESNEANSSQLADKVTSLESQLHLLLSEKESLLEENSKLKTLLLKEEDKLINRSRVENNSMKDEIYKLKEEKQVTSLLLEEKVQEIDLLQTRLKDLNVILEGNSETIKNFQQQKEIILNEKLQCEDKFAMTKESVSKLSELIKQKDQELSEIKLELSNCTTQAQQSDNISKQLSQAQEATAQILQERDQLFQTVHVKHQESLQYHAEIQRLSALLSQEMAKSQQLAAEHAALAQQCNEERVNGSPRHQQELQQLQELLRVKDDGLQQLCNRLELKEQELQARGMEIETLQHQVELMPLERVTKHAGVAGEDLQDKHTELLSKFQDEQRKTKNLQNELEICQGRESALQKELERLRVHLVEIEDMYTQEALKSEEHIKELMNKLQQAEDMMKSSSTVYKSANIRANQQVETLQEQARLIAQQRDDVQTKLSAAEDQVAKHAAALRNLQAVLEQFQRDREREIEAARASVYVKVEAAVKKHDDLLGEISSLKLQLKEAKEGLSAASRLGEELEKKTEVVNRLKQEVVQLEEKVQKSKEESKMAGLSVEGKVDKSLVKNVVLGFFLAPANSKEQVLHVVASVLDFSDDERGRVQKRLGLHGSEASGGWFKGLLHPSGQDQSNSQSLSEAFVRFLENESIPQPKLKMLPEAERKASTSSSSPRATPPVNAQRKSPLLLADVQLPTFAQFPVGRNSSSILKDILKES